METLVVNGNRYVINTEGEHFFNHLTLILNKYPSDALVCWAEVTEEDMLQYAIPNRMI